MPRELQLLNAIQAYGAQSVMGRTLGVSEIHHMNLAANIVAYYKQRAQSSDWVRWAADNEVEAALLNRAMIAAEAVSDG